MFKERRFLVGFGAGIIAGSLLLQLILTGQQAPSDIMNSDEKIYTEQEVQQLVEKAKEEAAAKQDEQQAGGSDGQGDAQAPAKPADPDQPSDPAEPSDPSAPADNEQAELPAEPKQPEAGAAAKPEQPDRPVSNEPEAPAAPDAQESIPVVIRIEPGMNLTKTAKLLADNGIITSQKQFIAKMKSDKKLVRAGFFAFTGQPTLEETIKKLTSQPLTEAEANRIKSNS